MAQYTKEEIAAVMENGSERDKAALQKALKGEGTFAQTYNQKIADQGVRAGATQIKSEPKKAPPKATAAPKKTTETSFTYTGLCAYLNSVELEYQKNGTVEIPNKYTVEFADKKIAEAKVNLPGGLDKTKTPVSKGKSAKDLDPKSNSMDSSGKNYTVNPGTQIVQFIEQVVRNSSYIFDQQKAIVDQNTGNVITNTSSSSSPATTNSQQSPLYFKISAKVAIIGDTIDKKRNDYAYHITYVVAPFAVDAMQSQFFNKPKYRGVHKVYDYWFTGQNTQVIHFEQQFNNLFNVVMSGEYAAADTTPNKSQEFSGLVSPYTAVRVPVTTSSEPNKGANNNALNPTSMMADFLYNVSDMGNLFIKITGDPAWIQQSEAVGTSGLNYNFQGFYPDGTINCLAQSPAIVLNWNPAGDYDLASGLTNINGGETGNNPNKLGSSQTKVSVAYRVNELVSNFSRGKFEQNLTGSLIKDLNETDINTIERLTPVTTDPVTTDSGDKEKSKPRVPQKTTPVVQPGETYYKNGFSVADTAGGAAIAYRFPRRRIEPPNP